MPLPENKNALDFPKFYYARHMRPGLVKGGGKDREKIYRVDLDAIKKMIPSGKGIPVYIEHQDVDFDTMKEDACGYVTESFIESDGWAWFQIMIIDDAAHQKIADGYSVSNAYLPLETGEGGVMHNCDYDIEILDGKFTHLALVPNPRYEEACIKSPDQFKIYREQERAKLDQLKNAKGENSMFKFFKSKKQEVTNASDLTEDSFLVIEGHKVSMKELIQNTKEKIVADIENEKDGDEDEADKETKKEEKDDEKKNKKSMKNEDDDMENSDVFDVDGEEVTLNDLKKAYKNSMKKNQKKNEKPSRTKGDEEDDGDNDKEDESYEEEKVNKKKENRNSHFDDLRNANEMGVTHINVETSMDKLKRGQQRYGTAA